MVIFRYEVSIDALELWPQVIYLKFIEYLKYFSDTPLKCVHYADDPGRSNPDEAYILKCRVILGDVKV